MLRIEIRPSNRMLVLLSQIERFSGAWPRLAQSAQFTSEQRQCQGNLDALLALAELDESMSPQTRYKLRELCNAPAAATLSELSRSCRTQSGVYNLLQALEADTTLNPKDLFHLHSVILSGGQTPAELRRQSSQFRTPEGEILFQTTAGFLIDSRLEELLSWGKDQLEAGDIHPLLIIGCLQLALIQLSPFTTLSHTSISILIWHELIRRGYPFVRFAHPVHFFQLDPESYFTVLRQAEKTAGSSWSTLSAWLEYFLETLARCCASLQHQSEQVHRNTRLSSVQQLIIEVVKENGSASREQIVSSTGINTSTVKYNLSQLAANGLLRRHGGGRSTSYTANELNATPNRVNTEH